MRFLLATVLLCAACGAAPHRPTAPTVPTESPASDLGAAKTSAPPAAPDERDHLPAKDPRVTDLDIIRITAHANGLGGDPELTSVASADLFRAANEAAKAKQYKDAIARYRQLVAEFPDSRFAPVALFDIAAVYDTIGDLESTITTLRELVAAYPQARESVEGHLYIAALQSDHARWDDAAATLAAVLARPNLTYADRVEAFARRGYVQLEQHELDQADASLAAAIDESRKAPHLEDVYYVAMAHYYQGELLHQKFAAAPLRLPDDQLQADLEHKRALAAKAYDRWKESLGYKQAYWATAAGYQMSQIFVELWEAHVTAPYPARVAPAARPAYVTEMHARVHADLEKALDGHRMNVELAKAYGVETEWSKGSAAQAARIAEVLAKEASGTLVQPPQ